MRPHHLVLLLLLVTLSWSSACAKRRAAASGTLSAPIESAPPAPAPPLDAMAPPLPASEPSEDELFARKSLAELNAERPLQEVFFPLDESIISPEGRRALQRNAEWLRRWSSTRVIIEGHCDERGSSEYNLALGERRASAVRSYLVSLGIDEARLLAVSKGKETPVCSDANEECWQRNRRAQSVITEK